MAEQTTAPIPDSHKHLITDRVYPVLVTLMPDGQPQAQVIWADLDGDYVLINTEASRQKARNMERDAKVTLIWVDPTDPHRFLEVRGQVASITEEDGIEVIEQLAWKYDNTAYFGGRVPLAEKDTQRRVTVRIRPTRVVTRK